MHIFDKYEKNLALSEQASNVQYKILIWLSVGWPYGISVSQMTTDMFHLSQTLPGPFLIHDLLQGV